MDKFGVKKSKGIIGPLISLNVRLLITLIFWPSKGKVSRSINTPSNLLKQFIRILYGTNIMDRLQSSTKMDKTGLLNHTLEIRKLEFEGVIDIR